jgi:uncharacterized membrane protein
VKRYLYLTHRWLGVALCAFMAMWFLSGVVMLYVGYPKLTPAERLAGLPALEPGSCCVEPARALAATGRTEQPKEIRLTSVAGAPRFVFTFGEREVIAVDAASARRIEGVPAAAALEAASAFGGGAAASYVDEVHEDAWTHSKALDPHRPLHRVQLADERSTLLYVSTRTGEIVRDATGTERTWNWVGAWIHWLYPFRGGVLDKQWHDIVVWLSVAGTVLALTGAAVGILRLRLRRRYRGGRHTPYRDAFMRWHHLLGLAFALVTIAWIFSGLMSMNPWKLFGASGLSEAQRLAFAGGPLEPGRFALSAREALARAGHGFAAREIVWQVFDGKGFYVLYDGAGRTLLLEARRDAMPMSRFEPADLIAAARRMMPEAPIVESRLLDRYDLYYYRRAAHTMSGHTERRLPVLRVKFGDAAETWLHLDPHTGQIQGKLDAAQRVRRWLFAGLHSWDLPVLLDHRPLWDVLMIGFSAGGFALSLTGVAIGWRRLRGNTAAA